MKNLPVWLQGPQLVVRWHDEVIRIFCIYHEHLCAPLAALYRHLTLNPQHPHL